MKQRVFNILLFFVIGVFGVVQALPNPEDTSLEIKVKYMIKKKTNFLSKSPQEGLMEALEYYRVKHPQIVYAQAVLETGHFKSDLCLNNNNLFGLYNIKKHRYHTFNHWQDCIVAYKEMVQYKYKGDNNKPSNDYYKFLQRIGYAKDPHYIKKLKRIVNDKKRSTRVSFIKG